MRKRLPFLIFISILVTWLTAACMSGIKMSNREDFGTPTKTPFLLKATYTITHTPLVITGEQSLTISNFIETPADTAEAEITEETSPTPSYTPLPEIETLESTATRTATKPASTSKPTKPPADTNTPKPPADTYTPKPTKPAADTSTPKPPADTNTPKPPVDTNTPVPPADTNTPKPPTATSPPGECVFSGNSTYENQVIALINQERTDRGLSALTKNASLTQAARRHSQDMACTDTWSHTGSDGSTLGTRISAAGYSYSWAAENIAASSSQYFSPSSVVSMWMGSTGHRNNILSPNAVHIGVGFRYAGDVNILPYDAYYTADFGAPR